MRQSDDVFVAKALHLSLVRRPLEYQPADMGMGLMAHIALVALDIYLLEPTCVVAALKRTSDANE